MEKCKGCHWKKMNTNESAHCWMFYTYVQDCEKYQVNERKDG